MLRPGIGHGTLPKTFEELLELKLKSFGNNASANASDQRKRNEHPVKDKDANDGADENHPPRTMPTDDSSKYLRNKRRYDDDSEIIDHYPPSSMHPHNAKPFGWKRVTFQSANMEEWEERPIVDPTNIPNPSLPKNDMSHGLQNDAIDADKSKHSQSQIKSLSSRRKSVPETDELQLDEFKTLESSLIQEELSSGDRVSSGNRWILDGFRNLLPYDSAHNAEFVEDSDTELEIFQPTDDINSGNDDDMNPDDDNGNASEDYESEELVIPPPNTYLDYDNLELLPDAKITRVNRRSEEKEEAPNGHLSYLHSLRHGDIVDRNLFLKTNPEVTQDDSSDISPNSKHTNAHSTETDNPPTSDSIKGDLPEQINAEMDNIITSPLIQQYFQRMQDEKFKKKNHPTGSQLNDMESTTLSDSPKNGPEISTASRSTKSHRPELTRLKAKAKSDLKTQAAARQLSNKGQKVDQPIRNRKESEEPATYEAHEHEREELRMRIAQYQKEAAALHALREETEHELHMLKVENRSAKERAAKEEKRMQEWIEEEKKKLKAEKLTLAKEARRLRGEPERDHREKLEQERVMFAQFEEEMTSRVEKLKTSLEIARKELRDARKENSRLREQLKLSEQRRLHDQAQNEQFQTLEKSKQAEKERILKRREASIRVREYRKKEESSLSDSSVAHSSKTKMMKSDVHDETNKEVTQEDSISSAAPSLSLNDKMSSNADNISIPSSQVKSAISRSDDPSVNSSRPSGIASAPAPLDRNKSVGPADDTFTNEHADPASSTPHILKEIVHPGGKIEHKLSNGDRSIMFSNGTRKIIEHTGRVRIEFPNGDWKLSEPTTSNVNGSTNFSSSVQSPEEGPVNGDRLVSVYYYASRDVLQSTYSSGLNVYRFGQTQTERHYPDGSKRITFEDGTIKHIDSLGRETSDHISRNHR